jgi:hypothetical protein
MPGHNHYADCSCGWCVKTRRRAGREPVLWLPLEFPSFRSYSSYTIPNAICPVCGERVFFYRSPYGGRVFFDILGPPWPKHPCTVQSDTSAIRRTALVDRVAQKSDWLNAGWIPVSIRYTRSEGLRALLAIEDINSGARSNVIADVVVVEWIDVLAHRLPWDVNGASTISLINFKERATPIHFAITKA